MQLFRGVRARLSMSPSVLNNNGKMANICYTFRHWRRISADVGEPGMCEAA